VSTSRCTDPLDALGTESGCASVAEGHHDRVYGDDPPPDIIDDYLTPDGPTIRHIGPALALPDRL
jgi:hypothetical protein